MKALSFGEVLFDCYPDKNCLGGAPLNFAVYLAIGGIDTYLLSAVGDDALGANAKSSISDFGVKTELLETYKEKQTGKCLVTLDQKGMPCYNLLNDVAYDFISYNKRIEDYNFDVLAFGTLSLRNENNRATLNQIIGNNKFLDIYVDLNLRKPFYSEETVRFALQNATILKLSDEELPFVSSILAIKEADEIKQLKAVFSAYKNIKLIILTKGADGSLGYDAVTGDAVYCPAEKCEIVSTVGAGDSFGSTYLASRLKGDDMKKSLALASKVSAYVVSHAGSIPENAAQDIPKIIETFS